MVLQLGQRRRFVRSAHIHCRDVEAETNDAVRVHVRVCMDSVLYNHRTAHQASQWGASTRGDGRPRHLGGGARTAQSFR